MLMRRLVLTLSLPALVATACGGGGGGVTAESFVGDVCTSLNDWFQTVQTEAAGLGTALSPQASPAEGKEVLTGFADAMVEETEQLVADIEAAGVPDVEGGQQASERLIGALNEATEALRDLREQIGDLPTDNPVTFAQEAEKVGTTIQTQFEDIGNRLGDLDAPALEAAAQDEPACAQLEGLG